MNAAQRYENYYDVRAIVDIDEHEASLCKLDDAPKEFWIFYDKYRLGEIDFLEYEELSGISEMRLQDYLITLMQERYSRIPKAMHRR